MKSPSPPFLLPIKSQLLRPKLWQNPRDYFLTPALLPVLEMSHEKKTTQATVNPKNVVL
jgi:hypothetical protein